jgi:hypothetical protein
MGGEVREKASCFSSFLKKTDIYNFSYFLFYKLNNHTENG